MKVIIFNAGLGNQIFTFLFYKNLLKQFPKDRIYGCYWSGGLNDHYGLELEKVFKLSLPPSSIFTDFLGKSYRLLLKLGFRDFLEKHEFAWWNPVFDYQWMDKQYFEGENLSNLLAFQEENVDDRNIVFSRQLQEECSVAVHVRRGDYLNPGTYENFGRFCTKEYYDKAIELLKSRLLNPKFYFFSDDMDYVRKEYSGDNFVYVDRNTDIDSWQDLYLMSKCQHHIIANSTFSYWAAQLSANKSENHIVIAPKRWYVWDDPNIFPDQWIRL